MPIKNQINLSVAAKEKYIEDLNKYTKVQLIEMRERQHKLLANRSRLLKLPDKGDRIQKLFNKIVEELEAREQIDQAAAMFSDLNIVENGVKTVTNMEWTGKLNNNEIESYADSDDDQDLNPLKIIAQNRAVKTVKIIKNESLITEADLTDIKELANESNESNVSIGSIELEPHAIHIIRKDKTVDDADVKKKFLPFRTTKSDVHSVSNEKQRKYSDKWEITAATPPILRNNAAKLLTLTESIEVEKQYKEKLRNEIEKQAAQRLATRKKIIAENVPLLPADSILMDPNSFFQSYRQRNEHFDDNDESDSFSEQSDNEN